MPREDIWTLLEDVLRSFFRIRSEDIQWHQGFHANCVTTEDGLKEHSILRAALLNKLNQMWVPEHR